jgi:hypothetical protein
MESVVATFQHAKREIDFGGSAEFQRRERLDVRLARTAGFQPAVSPIFNRLSVAFSERVQGNSLQQVENLRYSRLKTCGTSAPRRSGRSNAQIG